MDNYHKYSLISLFLIFFLIGLFIFKDFGLGLEETFQRASGFYWLSYLSELSGFENLKNISNIKYNEVYLFNPNLPKVTDNPSYGIILDVPVAFLEIFINFDNAANNIYLKHFFIFLIFFLSSITFCLMLLKRFSNFIVAFFGSLAYFFSPKIFGASFFDGKDLFFLSIFTITIYFYQKYETNKKITSLIIFSIFSAIATSSRVFGILIPIVFFIIYFLKILSENNYKKNISIIFIYFSSFLLFLFMHWPYLWNLTLDKIYRSQNIKVLFDGIYYDNLILPLSYIPKLIFLTTPIFILLFFLIGLFIVLRRFFIKLVNIKTNNSKIFLFDFWRSKNEELDFFILICFFGVCLAYITFNVQIYSSWRHFLFIHFFLTYFFSFFIYYFVLKLNYKIKYFFYMILLSLNFEMMIKLYLYHPYQYNYFNNILTKDKKLNYERDTSHLSRIDAIKDVLKYIDLNENNDITKLGTASWSPLEDVKYFFSKTELKKILFTGNSNLEDADFIYTNFMYELDPKFNKKYQIPKNFYLYKSVIKDGTLIYSVYKKK